MSTRRTRAKKNANEDVLKALAEQRAGKRSREYQERKEDEDVYEELTKEEYEALVAERREMDDFVVDDEGLYADDGEEIFDFSTGEKKKKKRKTGPRRGPKKTRLEEIKKIDSRFLRGGSTAATGNVDTEAGEDAMIDSLLDGLDDDVDDEDDNGGLVDTNKIQEMAIFAPQSKIRDPNNIEDELERLATVNPRRRKTLKSTEPKDLEALESEIHQTEPTIQQDEGEELAEDNLPPLPQQAEDDFDEEDVGEDIKLVNKAAKEEEPAIDEKSKRESTGSASSTTASRAKNYDAASNVAFDAVVSKSSDSLVNDNSLIMYYYDAYYERFAEDATVYLFGKALLGEKSANRKCVSVCVAVENIKRSVYVYPRKYFWEDPENKETQTDKPVNFKDVYEELKTIFKRMGVKKWGCKPVNKKFCFEQPYVTTVGNLGDADAKSVPAVPGESQFLNVVYSYSSPSLPRDLKGKTFEFVFGTGSSQLERLILDRELVGPCWLKIQKPAPSDGGGVSWCKHEFRISNLKNISKLPNPQPPSPPFSMMSLSLKTRLNPKTHAHEVCVASLQYIPSINVDSPLPNHWKAQSSTVTMACKIEGKSWPYDLLRMESKTKKKIIKHPNERALLSFLTNKISHWDPDIVVAHDLHGFIIDVLINRMEHHKVPHWSRIGRLKKSRYPRQSSRGGLSLVDFGIGSGRLMVDTQVSAKELVRENTYTLTYLSKVRLGEYRQELQSADVELAYSTGQNLIKLMDHTERDGDLTVTLMDKLQVVPLTKQLTTICGNLWSRSLRSARAERVEFLLLHKFNKLDYVVPEKLTGREKREKIAAKNKALGVDEKETKSKKRKKPKYEGGLVLEPKKGFYDKYVLLLDFNSLYPSIILEFDLCFTTVRHWEIKKPGEQVDLPMRDTDHKGLLPKVIKNLLSRRKTVKKLMKAERNPSKKKVLDIRQKAIKLVANSMYGCLGFSSSRFFCQPLASLITSQGRTILERTKQLAESSLGMQVIYGDTDSIMIYTDSDDYENVFKMGAKVKTEVNKLYRDLTIDIDGVFKKMLLLRKKKYAALTVSRNVDGILEAAKETKGLDLVRRDWSPISKSVGNFVLDRILSDASREEVVDKILAHLAEIRENVEADKIAPGRFVITKGLTKHPNDYPDAKSQPHVMVAKRMLQENKPVRVGAYIPYVICEGEQTLAQRAYHIDEVKKGNLKIDKKWYFSNQIFPPIARLCAPIKEISAAQIASSLGLDGRKYASYDKVDDPTEEAVLATVSSIQDDKERFKNCAALKLPCACGVHKKFDGIYDFELNKSGFSCATRGCEGLGTEAGMTKALNAISLAARKHITEYYEGWFQCGNQVCRKVTRTLPLGSAKCRLCYEPLQQKISDSMLYTQICYFQSLFDKERAAKNMGEENKRRKAAGLEELKIELTPLQEQICDEIHSFITNRFVRRSAYNYINLGTLFGVDV